MSDTKWYYPTETLPGDGDGTYVKSILQYSTPVPAFYDSATQTFTTVGSALKIPAWAVYKWRQYS